MTNRIQELYKNMETQIKQNITDGLTTQQKVDRAGKNLNMDWPEYARLQEHKSLAVSNGTFSAEEGMTIYQSLGESLEHFNKQPMHIKYILTEILQKLLEKQLSRN